MGYVNVQAQAALARLEQQDQEQVRAILQQLAQLARDAHDNVRGYILGIRTSTRIPGIRTLTRIPGIRAGESHPPSDFFAILQEYTDTLRERYGLAVQVSRPEEMLSSPLAPEVETQLLRIIQEGLSNVRKHANVDSARILFTLHPDEMQIAIQDEGQGFDATQNTKHETRNTSHFGLQIMRERAEAVDGRLEIRSAPGQGTQIIVRVPRVLQVPVEQIVRGLRVLLADDHPLFLEGLHNMLSARGVQVVGAARDGLEAQEMARRLRPDVILMDIHMPRCDGLEATRRIKIEMPEIKIVMLTVAAEDETLFTALKNGASGYLLKNLESGRFFDLLTDLQRGQVVLAPGLAARLLTKFAQPATKDETPTVGEPSAPLTQRQLKILRLVAQGVTYKEIAAGLNLSEQTIKYHMGRILEQLQLESREAAIVYAYKKGLVEAED